MIQYHPAEFSYENILELLADIQTWVNHNQLTQTYKRILFSKNLKKNMAFIGNRDIFIQIKNGQPIEKKKGYEQNQNFKDAGFNRDIKNVLLVYPVLFTDKRWISIDLPTAPLYLASALTSQSFQVQIKKIVFPAQPPVADIQQYDVIGITLYEDLFEEIKEYLTLLKKQYNGIIAAGGPMVTLNPMQTAYHLPQINLLIRGEAEYVFPELLKTLSKKNDNRLFNHQGFFFQQPGQIIVSDYSQVNYPHDFRHLKINLDFLVKNHLTNGLELNVSRGCRRGCLFCSKIQGKRLRKISIKKINQIIEQHAEKLNYFCIDSPGAKTINLNDDDILQDAEYAAGIFRLIQNHQYKIWGIQASINSFFNNYQRLNTKIIDLVGNKQLFVDRRPVVWLGTDTFLKNRGKRIGKQIPNPQKLEALVNELEQRDISNYHYWISSDHNSNWEEFVEEFLFIFELLARFKKFFLLPHSPFLIPYTTTPLYSMLVRNPDHREQIKYKTILKSRRGIFELPLVNRLETRYPNLNRLLKNEKADGENGFFDYLKLEKYVPAINTIYSFLKQERMAVESIHKRKQARHLKQIESRVEALLSSLI